MKNWWLGNVVVRALDSQLDGCNFDFRLPRCRVTTLDRLFTCICICRSQWSSGGMPGRGVRLWIVVFILTVTDIQPRHGQRTLTAVPIQPSTLSGMVKWVSVFEPSNNNKWATVDVDGSSHLSADSQLRTVCLVCRLATTRRSVCICQMNWINARSGSSHDDSIMNIVALFLLLLLLLLKPSTETNHASSCVKHNHGKLIQTGWKVLVAVHPVAFNYHPNMVICAQSVVNTLTTTGLWLLVCWGLVAGVLRYCVRCVWGTG